MFILAIEVLLELIKNNADIREIAILNHAFLDSAFADDSTFFLNNLFSELEENFSKCKIARLGSLKGVLEAVCSLKSIDLPTDTINF